MTEQAPHPASEAVPDRITFDDLYAAVLSEVDRARLTRDNLYNRAAEEKVKANKSSWMKAAADYDRKLRIFEKLLTLVDRVSTDPMLIERLAELKRQEATDQADNDSDGQTGGTDE